MYYTFWTITGDSGVIAMPSPPNSEKHFFSIWAPPVGSNPPPIEIKYFSELGGEGDSGYAVGHRGFGLLSAISWDILW